MAQVFAADLARSTPVTAATLPSLSVGTRTMDALYYWYRAQL